MTLFTTNHPRRAVASVGILAFAAVACNVATSGGADTRTGTSGSPVAVAAPADSTSSTTPDAPSCGRLIVDGNAATLTAQTDPLCTSIQPFYWEIGDGTSTANSLVASGSLTPDGGAPVLRDTTMEIASASKLYFGAYTVESNRVRLALPENKDTPVTPALDTAFHALTMRTGYDHMESDLCALSENLDAGATVADCFHVGNNDQPTLVNGQIDTTDFDYNGGNFQSFGTNDIGLGGYTASDLADEYHRVLGADLNVAFKFPDLAGGMQIAPGDYASFLRKILNGNLLISQYLDYAPVCTLPASEDRDAGPACPTATYSPAPDRPWQYSWGHWIESDGAYSSPGKLGFYPWIDHCEKYYGIVARQDSSPAAYIASAECGEDIRSALFSGRVYANGAPVPILRQ